MGIIKYPFLCSLDHSQTVFGYATAPSSWPLGQFSGLPHSGSPVWTPSSGVRVQFANILSALGAGGGGNSRAPPCELPGRAGAGPRGAGRSAGGGAGASGLCCPGQSCCLVALVKTQATHGDREHSLVCVLDSPKSERTGERKPGAAWTGSGRAAR